jgi:hypothetical protein
MKIKVMVVRSDEWVKARRIETGENVESSIRVPVEVSELSQEVRQRLLDYDYKGEYADLDRVHFDRDRLPTRYAGYGYREIKIDSDNPTAEEISQAVLDCFAEIGQERAKWEADQAERAEEERQQAEIEKYKQKQLSSARELLKEELDELKETKAKLLLLSEFVGEIPDDACRGALKSLHRKRTAGTLVELQKEIEESAVKYVVFDESNNEGDDQE